MSSSSKGKVFADNWSYLLSAERLFVPVEFVAGEETAARTSEPFLDLSSTLIKVGGKNSVALYTDPSFFASGTQYVSATPEEMFRGCFFLPQLEAALVNYPFSERDEFPHYCFESSNPMSLDKVTLARVLGGLLLGSFPVLEGKKHAEEAERLLWQDRLFESFYHSVAARVGGAERDDYFFAEIDALFSFGFLPQVEQYLKWYQQSGKHTLYCLEHARWLVASGDFDGVNQWLEGASSQKELSFQSLYIQGLANAKQQRFTEAIVDFSCCLEKFEHHQEARLGLGIALRNEGLRRNNSAMLKEAAHNFLEVARVEGYHAPEALAHLGALMISFRNWEKAKAFLRHSLKLRENPITRGFLEKALEGAGRGA